MLNFFIVIFSYRYCFLLFETVRCTTDYVDDFKLDDKNSRIHVLQLGQYNKHQPDLKKYSSETFKPQRRTMNIENKQAHKRATQLANSKLYQYKYSLIYALKKTRRVGAR